MKYRAYFKLKLTLLSPLSIGSSNSESTDRDVVLDSRGKPVIPATAVAGVFRSLSDEDNKKLFGDIEKFEYNKNGKQVPLESKLLFYDAQLSEEKPVSIRDSVALNKYKSAKDGAKFDFEIVETGAVFIGYVEANTTKAAELFENLLGNKLYLGAKSTRGYGSVSVEYKKKIFREEDTDKWLEFEMFKDSSWESEDCKDWKSPEEIGNYTTITLSLKQNGGLSIRQYSTEPKEADSVPLSLGDGTRVIPGTSWAGMFRSHMAKLLNYGEKGLDKLFGFVDTENKSKSAKSKICFSESQISDAVSKILTRNAIDRFTNGTKDGALFTEVTVYNGRTELQIEFRGKICDKIKNDIEWALAAALLDLHNGYIAVGGLTSVGRGMFTIDTISTKNNPCKKFEEYRDNEKSGWNLKKLKEDIFDDRNKDR